MAGDFYGLGFAFPPRVDPTTGALATVGETAVVAQAIRLILRTQPGDRLMRPAYGCDLKQFLFNPNTVATRRLIAQEVTRAINGNEDRVRLDSVDVTASEVEPAQVDIAISYTLVRTGAVSGVLEPLRLDVGQR
jgi:phage baseplate assembly protein W